MAFFHPRRMSCKQVPLIWNTSWQLQLQDSPCHLGWLCTSGGIFRLLLFSIPRIAIVFCFSIFLLVLFLPAPNLGWHIRWVPKPFPPPRFYAFINVQIPLAGAQCKLQLCPESTGGQSALSPKWEETAAMSCIYLLHLIESLYYLITTTTYIHNEVPYILTYVGMKINLYFAISPLGRVADE